MDKLKIILIVIFLLMLITAIYNYWSIKKESIEHFGNEQILRDKNGFWGQGPANYNRAKLEEVNYVGQNGQQFMGFFYSLEDAIQHAKERGIPAFTLHGSTMGEWANTAWTAGNWSASKLKSWANEHPQYDNFTVILQKQTEIKEGNANVSGPLDCKVRVDDEFYVVYNNQRVYDGGSDTNKVHNFTIDNVRPGTFAYFVCSNTGSTGAFKGDFEYAGRKFFSGVDTIHVANREVKTKFGNRTSGSKYLGCFKDRSERDLVKYEGIIANSDECFKRAIMSGKRYFGLQNGNECYTGNQYGRYGQATNCDMYNRNSWEHGGGSFANEVYDTQQQANIVEVMNNWPGFSPMAKAVWANNDRAYGTYWFALRIPEMNKIEYCPDIAYQEFNPAACKSPLDSALCASTPYTNYKSMPSMCNKRVDYNNFRKIYEQIASVWELIGNPREEVSRNIRKLTDDIYFGDNAKSCANKDWKEKQDKINYFIMDSKVMTKLDFKKNDNNPGLNWVFNFLQDNYKLTKTLKPFAEMINYPIDITQLTPNGDIAPDTPQYYSLIEKAIKYSGENEGLIPDRFKKQLKAVYDVARVINGNPKQARECNCLYTGDNLRQCIPC